MENDYEMKYTILTFYNTGCYKVGVYLGDNVSGYIVTPAYLISKRSEKTTNNNIREAYEVVMLYKNDKQEVPNYPEFDNEKCINSMDVYLVFDNLFEAKEYTEFLNNGLRLYFELISKDKSKYGLEKKISSLDDDLARMNEYERAILLKLTKDKVLKR